MTIVKAKDRFFITDHHDNDIAVVGFYGDSTQHPTHPSFLGCSPQHLIQLGDVLHCQRRFVFVDFNPHWHGDYHYCSNEIRDCWRKIPISPTTLSWCKGAAFNICGTLRRCRRKVDVAPVAAGDNRVRELDRSEE